MQPLLSRAETAALLGVSRRSLDRIVGNGELVAVRIGDRVLFEHEDVRALVARAKYVAKGRDAEDNAPLAA